MKLYIWHGVNNVTDNWYHGGAVLIITDRNYNDAWKEYVAEIEHPAIRSALPETDLSYEVNAEEERVFVYENAGCC